jgi:hypothetical protein
MDVLKQTNFSPSASLFITSLVMLSRKRKEDDRLDGQDMIHVECKIFSLLHSVKIGYEDHLSSGQMGTAGKEKGA